MCLLRRRAVKNRPESAKFVTKDAKKPENEIEFAVNCSKLFSLNLAIVKTCY